MKRYYRHELTGIVKDYDDHIANHPILGKHLIEVDPNDVECYTCGITEDFPLELEPLEDTTETVDIYHETEEGYGY